MVGTEDGILHRCSVSYNEQYLDNYFGHAGPVYIAASRLLVPMFSSPVPRIGPLNYGIRKRVVNKGIYYPFSQVICLIMFQIFVGHHMMPTYSVPVTGDGRVQDLEYYQDGSHKLV